MGGSGKGGRARESGEGGCRGCGKAGEGTPSGDLIGGWRPTGTSGPGPARSPPLLRRRPHGPTPLIASLGHAPAAPAAALGHEPPRGSRAEQLPEPRPRRGWGPRWPGRGRGAGGGGGGGRRRGETREVGGRGCVFRRLSAFLSATLPIARFPPLHFRPRLWSVSVPLPAAGSRRFCGFAWRCDSGPARRDLPCSCGSVWPAVLRVSGPLRLRPSVLVSLGALSRSLSPSRFLFGGEGFVSTVTRSSGSGIGEGTLRFRDPSPPPSRRRREVKVLGPWRGHPRRSGGWSPAFPGD